MFVYFASSQIQNKFAYSHINMCTRNLIFFSHSPPPPPPAFPSLNLRHLNRHKIEISTIHRSARKTGSSELWRNLHVKIRSAAFGSNNFTCENYHFSVKSIALQKTVIYIINRNMHGCLETPDLFLVLNMISHSFAALTLES